MKTISNPSPCFHAILALAGLCLVLSAPAQDASNKTVDVKERQLAEKATNNLGTRWVERIKSAAVRAAAKPPEPPAPHLLMAVEAEAGLTPPRRQSLALSAKGEFVEPDVVQSKGGELRVTLKAAYADNKIGADPVYLRAFNGKLVGPTLRVKRGDKLHITVKNAMPPERWLPNMMNTLNSFNTMNMHYHGLHVSPNGISDNVLIQIGPDETQEYEIDLPADHTPGTYWYHPHRHGSTAGDVASGMSGALIIAGGLDDIPEIKAAKDRVMVLNQIPYIYKSVTPPLEKGVIEAKYANIIFGPGDWGKLGRYTTINGVQLPVIRLRPGQIERWRLVDSGQREMIMLKIIPSPGPGGGAGPIPFHEIAVDGLALGKMVETPTIELWPGYRSDVLVQAPTTAGEYLLIDDAVPASNTISGENKPLNYVARIIVEGDAVAMPMPTNQQMAKLRLPSIKNEELTGTQTAKYGILLVGNSVVFTIDGKSFDMETARQLKLNDVDEWTISSLNDVGLVTHPFHIHVNPFEVTSIMAPALDANKNVIVSTSTIDGNGHIVSTPKLVEQLKDGPVWRDTVKIPGGGYVKMRTRYTDFIGTFVQHCHILDHEDQGMMQLIDIVDNAGKTAANQPAIPAIGGAAPGFALADAEGRIHSLQEFQGKPAVVFFFKGHGCLHCVLQVTAFAEHFEAFARRGIQVIGVTSDDVETLKAALGSSPLPFPILADPKGVAFAKFGCVDAKGLRHGTFSLDALGHVTWSTVDASPFLGVKELLKDAELSASEPKDAAPGGRESAKSVTALEVAEAIQLVRPSPPGDATNNSFNP
jgi:FtsP/CotA-like multicopper oxidase with cupredoxin domain/peroxiredoxin